MCGPEPRPDPEPWVDPEVKEDPEPEPEPWEKAAEFEAPDPPPIPTPDPEAWRGGKHTEDWPQYLAGPEYWLYMAEVDREDDERGA